MHIIVYDLASAAAWRMGVASVADRRSAVGGDEKGAAAPLGREAGVDAPLPGAEGIVASVGDALPAAWPLAATAAAGARAVVFARGEVRREARIRRF